MEITDRLVNAVVEKVLSGGYYLNVKYPYVLYVRSNQLVEIVNSLTPARVSGADIARLVRKMRIALRQRGYVMIGKNGRYIIAPIRRLSPDVLKLLG